MSTFYGNAQNIDSLDTLCKIFFSWRDINGLMDMVSRTSGTIVQSPPLKLLMAGNYVSNFYVSFLDYE